MFTHDYLLHSDWHQERLKIKQARDEHLWQKNYDYIKKKLDNTSTTDFAAKTQLESRLREAEQKIIEVPNKGYLHHLQGTLGADWEHNNPDIYNDTLQS